jgi:excisionase family DNA binding protein
MPANYVIQGDLPPVLTVAQVQEVLGLGKAKAYEVVHQAAFPALRFGKVIRVPRDAFFRWLEERAAVTQPA